MKTVSLSPRVHGITSLGRSAGPTTQAPGATVCGTEPKESPLQAGVLQSSLQALMVSSSLLGQEKQLGPHDALSNGGDR